MKPKRVGSLLYGLGVGLAALSTVVFGLTADSTDISCRNHDPSYAIQNVDILTFGIEYTDGCNTFLFNPLITVGVLTALVGLAIGASSVVQSTDTDQFE